MLIAFQVALNRRQFILDIVIFFSVCTYKESYKEAERDIRNILRLYRRKREQHTSRTKHYVTDLNL